MISWEEICDILASRYGKTPMQIWEEFPLRFLRKYYYIALKEKIKAEIFMARLQGAKIDEPDWSKFDIEGSGHKDAAFSSDEDYEREKQICLKKRSTALKAVNDNINVIVPGIKKQVEVNNE